MGTPTQIGQKGKKFFFDKFFPKKIFFSKIGIEQNEPHHDNQRQKLNPPKIFFFIFLKISIFSVFGHFCVGGNLIEVRRWYQNDQKKILNKMSQKKKNFEQLIFS